MRDLSSANLRRWVVLPVLAACVAAIAAFTAGNILAADARLVCIDPGHGGTDPGAVNEAYSLLEKDINLDVSMRLKALLEANGYQVELTRMGDVYLDNRDRYTFCNGVGADILVSVHTNSSTNTEIDGTMTLYFQDDDRVLAGALHEVMYPALSVSDWAFTDFGLSKFASGVLMKSNMPAALVEPVLMSYAGEAELLQGDARRQQIAQSVFDGIENYFTNYVGGGDNNNCPPKSKRPGCQ